MTETELLDRIEILTAERDYWKTEAIGAADARRVARVAQPLGLTHNEAWLVLTMYDLRGKTVGRVLLNENMPGKGWERSEGTNVAEVLICRIRAKMAGYSIIETVRGAGYRLTADGVRLVEAALQ